MGQCRGEDCTTEIIFGKDEVTGKTIPLDTRAPVYRITQSNPASGVVTVERVADCFVSHFATCVNAPQFSASRKKDTS